MSGKISDQLVFKHYGNRTIVSKMPDMSKVKRSVKQKTENQKFYKAAMYARAQMADPLSKAEYKAKVKGLQRPYNVAIADDYHSPEIRSIDLSEFRSKGIIAIHAIDDFKVVKVTVEIFSNEGVLTEKGEAGELREWFWEYRVKENYERINNLKILMYAWDKPGNRTLKEIVAE